MSEEVADWSLKRVIESILFASQRPVSTKDLHGILKSAAEMEKADPNAARFVWHQGIGASLRHRRAWRRMRSPIARL